METLNPSDEYLRILDRELKAVVGLACRQTIRAQALALIKTMFPEDFRHWVRSLVRKTTGTTKDPRKAQKKRTIILGRPDSLGGAQLTGYLPAPSLAIVHHILATSRPVPSGDKDDERNAGQRRHDRLMTVLANKTQLRGHHYRQPTTHPDWQLKVEMGLTCRRLVGEVYLTLNLRLVIPVGHLCPQEQVRHLTAVCFVGEVRHLGEMRPRKAANLTGVVGLPTHRESPRKLGVPLPTPSTRN